MKAVELTKNEREVLEAIVANAKQVGDNEVEFILEDVAKTTGKSIRSISATAGSLAKKGMLLTANGDSYFDGEVTEAGLHEVEESDKVNQEVNNNKNQDNMEDKNFDAQHKAKKTASKKETKKADKTEQPKEKASKTARKVGDVHPKHPTWVWTEYAPGKFDWRTNPKDKKQGQRTDMADKNEKQPKSKAADKKAAKGKEKKQEAPKKAEKPIYTIDEWVALPTKPTTAKSKMSEAQKEAFKLINKGYRITADKKFFQNAEGDNKACNWASVEAMLKRYGIDYVPMGLIKEDKNEK